MVITFVSEFDKVWAVGWRKESTIERMCDENSIWQRLIYFWICFVMMDAPDALLNKSFICKFSGKSMQIFISKFERKKHVEFNSKKSSIICALLILASSINVGCRTHPFETCRAHPTPLNFVWLEGHETCIPARLTLCWSRWIILGLRYMGPHGWFLLRL